MRRVKVPQKGQKYKIRGVKKIPRGGFQVPRVPNGLGMRAAEYLRPYATNVARRALKDAGSAGIEFAKKLADNMKVPEQVTQGPKTVGRVAGQGVDSISGSNDTVPFIQEEATRSRNMGNKSYTMKKYYTTFEAGRPSTRAVKRIASNNGTTNITTYNSQYDAGTEVLRTPLRLETGFNQRLLAVNTDWSQKGSTYYGAFDLVNWESPNVRLQTIYGVVTHMWRKFTFMNTNAYLPLTVKVRLWTPTGDSHRISTTFAESVQVLADPQQDNRFPKRFQLTDIDQTDPTWKVKVDPRISYKNAAGITGEWTEVKSFSKKLAPGEIWYWNQKTHCGPGLHLTNLLAAHDDLILHSLDYEITVEVVGVPCEGIVGAQANDHIIGTGPGYVQMEWSKGYEAALAPVDESNYNTVGGGGGMRSGIFAIRAFTKFEDGGAGSDKIRHWSPSDIENSPTTVGGKLFIPVMSNTQIVYAQERGD